MEQRSASLLREHNHWDAEGATGCSRRCCHLQLLGDTQKLHCPHRRKWSTATHTGLLPKPKKHQEKQMQACPLACNSSHLHATNSDSNNSRCTLLTFADLIGLLLLWCIISVLSGSHFKVQHAWYFVSRCQVFQQNEFWLVKEQPSQQNTA